MRIFVRVLAVLLVVGVVLGIGSVVYNAGVNVGMSAAADAAGASGAPHLAPYAYGYGPGPYWNGPGILGIFAWIFGFILVIWAVRAAVGWGGGPGGHGHWSSRRARLEELHRDMHRNDAGPTERSAAT